MLKFNSFLIKALSFPVTGERSDILPFIIGGGLVLAAVVLIVLKTRRKDDDQNDLKS